MACPKCLTPALPGSAFCTECGAPLERRCLECGADSPAGARFCRVCGRPLDEPRTPPVRTPAAYTPRHLSEKVLTSRAALEGQRKQVTVLFIDVKSSQQLAQSVDPEVWHGVLDRYFEILGAGVHRFEGTINQYTGDGIMAIFGAPIAHEDHAQRACFAALALRDELAAFSAELRRSRGLDFTTRMGINSGEVVVGRIGDDLRMDYTAQGHTVGLAARMEALAEPGKIYLTKPTARLVDGFFDLKDLGRFSVRGEPRSLRVYELRGVGRLRTRFEVARARGFSVFVGREAEMATLEESLARALSGHGHAVGIASEPGVGKSRLCFEFSDRCRARGITVLEAVGMPHARSIPLVPIAELLRAFFAIGQEQDTGIARDRITREAARLGERFAGALPRLFELLRIEGPDPSPRHADPEVRQRELLALVSDLVRVRSAYEPLLIVAEDLPSFDAASAKVIAKLMEDLRGTHTLLVASRRIGQRIDVPAGAEYSEIVLEPLSPAAARSLTERLLGDHPSVAGLASRIAERSDGHPFFIEEMIRALETSRELTGEEGEYRAVGTVAELALPATVSALLDARIDALGERERLVLQAASVLGRKVSVLVLERVVDLSPDETRAALDALCEVGLLRCAEDHAAERWSLGDSILGFLERLTRTDHRDERLYEFRHALLQEVAYRSQLAQHRNRVHAEVARTLEGLDPAGADERAGVIAHHLECAGEPLAAAEWYARAARAQGIHDPAESFRCWLKVRSLCREVAETEESLALYVRAGIQALNLSWRIGIGEDEVAAIFEETREAAERSGRPDALAGALGTFGIVRGMAGHARESRARILEATRLAASASRPALEVALLSALTYAEASTGDLEAALASAEHGLDLGGGDVGLGADLALFRPVAFLTALRGFVLIHLGRLDDGARALDRAQEISDPERDAEVLGWIGGWRVLHARFTGGRDGALPDARRALEIAERNTSPFSQVIALASLGRAHALVSEWPAAVDALERSLALARSRRTGLETEAAILADLATALLHAGDPERAVRLANEAAQIAHRRGLRLDEGFADLALARILLATSGRAKRRTARKSLDRALEIAREIGARCLEAEVHLALAEIAKLAGDGPAAAGELSLALALFRQIGAGGHAARVAAELDASARAAQDLAEPEESSAPK